jgi:glycerol-3-phosphate acyltransferase PlsY
LNNEPSTKKREAFVLELTFLIIFAYLMGSVCSAIIVCRLFSLPDPRTQGSKNPGASNVLRLAGKQYAAYVIVGDVLKGAIPVLLAKYVHVSVPALGFMALAAVVGHIYPIFFGFKGGKGVATAIGALLGLNFVFGTLVAATWIILVNVTRYASLASIASVALAPLYSLFIVRGPDLFPPLLIIAILVIYKHRGNITRLMEGTEPKIQLKNSVLEDAMEPTPDSPHEPITNIEPPVASSAQKNTATKKKAAKPKSKKKE